LACFLKGGVESHFFFVACTREREKGEGVFKGRDRPETDPGASHFLVTDGGRKAFSRHIGAEERRRQQHSTPTPFSIAQPSFIVWGKQGEEEPVCSADRQSAGEWESLRISPALNIKERKIESLTPSLRRDHRNKKKEKKRRSASLLLWCWGSRRLFLLSPHLQITRGEGEGTASPPKREKKGDRVSIYLSYPRAKAVKKKGEEKSLTKIEKGERQ